MADFDEILKLQQDKMDKRFEYRWCLDDKKNMVKRNADGYVKVFLSEETKWKDDPRANTVDGLVRVGDLILMKCPKEKVAERRRARIAKADPGNAYAAVKEEFRQAATKAGVATVEENS